MILVTVLFLIVLARTCTESVPVLAGDIGQSGLVPGRETKEEYIKKCKILKVVYSGFRAKRGAPLPTRYGDFIPLGRPAGGGRGSPKKFSEKFPDMGFGINIIA